MPSPQPSRRQFLQGAAATGLALAYAPAPAVADEQLPPVRTITRGPKHHWFGYYDKLEFDPSCRYVLGMAVDFEHRSPRPDDVIQIGMVDLRDNNRWVELGQSSAWGWQQGCMLQWLPGSATEILWNDRAGDHFVCHILDTKTRRRRTLPQPIYTLSPDGRSAVAVDFRRLNDVRPGYGYCGLPDPYADELTPKDTGIFLVDPRTGKQQLILALADVAKFGATTPDMQGAKHWFNHLLFNPDGSRFIFLHRWRPKGMTGFRTRMLTATPDGKDMYVVDPSGFTSHFIWRDPRHILAWTRPFGREAGFYLFKDQTPQVEQIGKGVMTQNGHCTYLPGNDWILNDTYPDRDRLQHPYLYHVTTGRKVPLGHFLSPKEYSGEWRCDTHPRFSPDGKSVVIDSPHTSAGRQLHMIDISGIVGQG
ncbi:MAG: twin-arginine translocation signal domain-containing protein [Gemmataceae bacterium]